MAKTPPEEFERWAENFINNSGMAHLVKDQASAQMLLERYMSEGGEISKAQESAIKREVMPRVMEKLNVRRHDAVRTSESIQSKNYKTFDIKSDGTHEFVHIGHSHGKIVYARETKFTDKRTGKIRIAFRDRKGRIVRVNPRHNI